MPRRNAEMLYFTMHPICNVTDAFAKQISVSGERVTPQDICWLILFEQQVDGLQS
jgi:hypothetical protein